MSGQSNLRNNPLLREWAKLAKVCRESSPYESFEYIIILFITMLIMVLALLATVMLVGEVWKLLWSGDLAADNISALQDIFGDIFTIIIALEFKSSLHTGTGERKEVVRGRAIMLIALLAVSRKFIILDLHTVAPEMLLALAAATLALGAVYWLIREQDPRVNVTPPGHEGA